MVQQQVTFERGWGPCVAFRCAKGYFHMVPQHVTTETHNLNHAGQPADGAIEGAAAIRLDLGPNFGLSGPSVGGAVWPIFLRAHAAMDAPCAIARASWDLRLSEFSANGTGWQPVALFRRPSISPRSRFSTWGAGWPARPQRVSSFVASWLVARMSTGQIGPIETSREPRIRCAK
jgi:hypothetical protein